MLHLYYMDIDCGCSYEQSQIFYRALPEERQERIKRLSHAGVAKKKVLSGIFLQYGLSKTLDMDIKDIGYGYGPQGKPYLDCGIKNNQCGGVLQEKPHMEGEGKRLEFNLSHSGKYAVLAVSDQPVGIDVERMKKNRLSVAKRCFCTEEYEDIVQAGDEWQQNIRFLEYWTMKEAYVKRTGEGLRISLNSFRILREDNGLSTVKGEDDLWFATGFLEQGSYGVSVCQTSRENVAEVLAGETELHEVLAVNGIGERVTLLPEKKAEKEKPLPMLQMERVTVEQIALSLDK
jgi:phosphopantetheine--protein transferase-like protein